jgi:hypothetical protein
MGPLKNNTMQQQYWPPIMCFHSWICRWFNIYFIFILGPNFAFTSSSNAYLNKGKNVTIAVQQLCHHGTRDDGQQWWLEIFNQGKYGG